MFIIYVSFHSFTNAEQNYVILLNRRTHKLLKDWLINYQQFPTTY